VHEANDLGSSPFVFIDSERGTVNHSKADQMRMFVCVCVCACHCVRFIFNIRGSFFSSEVHWNFLKNVLKADKIQKELLRTDEEALLIMPWNLQLLSVECL
jgi:hypothetical protein